MHELALMTLLLWGVGYAAFRLADRLRISRLALGVAAGLLLGPAVLGQASPGVYEKYFGGGREVQQEIESIQSDRMNIRRQLAATGVTPIAVEQFDMETARLLEPLKAEQVGRIEDRDQFKWLLLHITGLMVLAGLAGEYPFRLRELRGRVAKRFALVMFMFLAIGWAIRTGFFNLLLKYPQTDPADAWNFAFYQMFMVVICIGAFVAMTVGVLSERSANIPDDRRCTSRLIKALVLLFALSIFLPFDLSESIDKGIKPLDSPAASSSAPTPEGIQTGEASQPASRVEIDYIAQFKSLFILTVEVPAGTLFLIAAVLLLIWYALKIEKVDTEAASHDPLAFPYPVMPLLALGLLMLGGASPFLIVALACLFLDGVKGMKTVGAVAHQAAAPLLMALSGLKAGELVYTGYADWVGSCLVIFSVMLGAAIGTQMMGLVKIGGYKHYLSITRQAPLNYALALLAVGAATGSIGTDLKAKWFFGSAMFVIGLYALIGGLLDRFNEDNSAARQRKV